MLLFRAPPPREPGNGICSGAGGVGAATADRTGAAQREEVGETELSVTQGSVMNPPVRIACVADFESLWPRAGAWNALVRANRTDTVFQTFEWQAAWCRAFGADVRLLLLLAEAGGELVGIAPLMVSAQSLLRHPRRVVEFIGSESADYCDFILGREEVLPLFLEWLVEHRDLWDVVDLSNLADTSPLLEALPQYFAARGLPVDLQHLCECQTRLLVDPEEDRKLLNKKSIRRHENWFRRSGTLEFRYLEDPREVGTHLGTFFDQHVRRWGPAGYPSRFLDERHRAFYRNLVELMLPDGRARLSVLEFNGRPIAYEFGFEYGNRYYAIKPTFEPEFADHSPGTLIQKYCMDDVIERGLAEYDFTVGDEAYKSRYANHVRHAYRARVYPSPFAYHRDRLMLWTRRHVWNARKRLRAARGGG